MIRFELVELWLYFPLYNDNSRLEDSVNCGEEPRRASSQVTIPFISEFVRIPTYRTNLPVCVWKHSHRSCSSLLLCRPCHGRCYDVLTTLSPIWSRPFGCKSNPRFFAFVVFCLRLVERANHGFWLWSLWFLYHLHQQESWRGNCSHQGKAEVNLFELHISNSRPQFLAAKSMEGHWIEILKALPYPRLPNNCEKVFGPPKYAKNTSSGGICKFQKIGQK